MGREWTPERRAKFAAAIHRWKPWTRSTGPRTPEGKARANHNRDYGKAREGLREMARLLREMKD